MANPFVKNSTFDLWDMCLNMPNIKKWRRLIAAARKLNHYIVLVPITKRFHKWDFTALQTTFLGQFNYKEYIRSCKCWRHIDWKEPQYAEEKIENEKFKKRLEKIGTAHD